jgi:hypothetical protein
MRPALVLMWAAVHASGVIRPLAAQVRAADLVTAARAQLARGNVDSGLVLVRLALEPGAAASTADRVNALVWRGVLQYFKGGDSLARESFREALTIDPRLEVTGLADLDSLLAVDLEAVRRSISLPVTAARPSAALARLAGGPSADTVYACTPDCRGVDQPPRPLAAESQTVTVSGAGMGGVALVRFVVDTAGAVEPASVAVMSSPGGVSGEALAGHLRRLRFAPGRVQGRAVRVMLQWRLSVRGP